MKLHLRNRSVPGIKRMGVEGDVNVKPSFREISPKYMAIDAHVTKVPLKKKKKPHGKANR